MKRRKIKKEVQTEQKKERENDTTKQTKDRNKEAKIPTKKN